MTETTRRNRINSVKRFILDWLYKKLDIRGVNENVYTCVTWKLSRNANRDLMGIVRLTLDGNKASIVWTVKDQGATHILVKNSHNEYKLAIRYEDIDPWFNVKRMDCDTVCDDLATKVLEKGLSAWLTDFPNPTVK
jgi:hypothetical protein